MTEKPSRVKIINTNTVTTTDKEKGENISKNKKDKVESFIFGRNPEIDLEYILKGLSWIIVASIIMAIGMATETEIITNPNPNHIYDKVIGILLVICGAVLGIICAVRVSFAPAYPLLKKKFLISVPIGIFLIGLTLSMSLSFLQILALFQVGKIYSLSKALHVSQIVKPIKKQ